MSNSLLPNEYNVSDAFTANRKQDGYPREAILDTVPRSALGATKKIVNLIPISGGNVGPVGQVQFLIPQRALAKAHSFYLNFRLLLTAAQCTSDWSFSGCSQSAASLINNITIQAGGAIIESLQNYHLWHNNIMPWAADGRSVQSIESIASGSALPDSVLGKYLDIQTAAPNGYLQSQSGYFNQAIGATPAGNVGAGNFLTKTQWSDQFQSGVGLNTTFSIPLHCGFFNPKEGQFVPLQFINGGVLVTIQMNSLLKAFSSAANVPSDFVMSEFELCYAEITPSPDYIMKIRSELAAEDKRIRIECQSYQQYLTACGPSVRQMFNANLTSLAAVFWGRSEANDTATSTKCFYGVNNDGDTNVYYQVYLDNVQIYQSANQLNQMSAQIRQLQEAIQASVSDYVSVPITIGRGNGSVAAGMGTMFNQNMLFGLSTKLFSSNSVSMDGVPVNTLTIQFSTSGDSSANVWYMYLVYDFIYTVDASGSVQKFA